MRPTAHRLPVVWSITSRNAFASQAHCSTSKLNAECSSCGRTYRASRSAGDNHASATNTLALADIGVLVGDSPPPLVDGVDTRLVVERVPTYFSGSAPRCETVHVGQRPVLRHRVGHVDPEAVDAAVEPEPQDRVEFLELPQGSPSSSPAAGCRTGAGTTARPSIVFVPGGATERGRPVVRRHAAFLTVPEPEQVAFRGTLPAASAALNQGAPQQQWFGTRSISTRSPWSWARGNEGVRLRSSVPKSGWILR